MFFVVAGDSNLRKEPSPAVCSKQSVRFWDATGRFASCEPAHRHSRHSNERNEMMMKRHVIDMPSSLKKYTEEFAMVPPAKLKSAPDQHEPLAKAAFDHKALPKVLIDITCFFASCTP